MVVRCNYQFILLLLYGSAENPPCDGRFAIFCHDCWKVRNTSELNYLLVDFFIVLPCRVFVLNSQVLADVMNFLFARKTDAKNSSTCL